MCEMATEFAPWQLGLVRKNIDLGPGGLDLLGGALKPLNVFL